MLLPLYATFGCEYAGGDLWKILAKPPFHPNSAQAADCSPNINLQNVAQSSLSTCYSEYSNRITLKSAAIAALFVFLDSILSRIGAEAWTSGVGIVIHATPRIRKYRFLSHFSQNRAEVGQPTFLFLEAYKSMRIRSRPAKPLRCSRQPSRRKLP